MAIAYTGSRYIPIFGRAGEDTVEWDNSKDYEALTIVTKDNATYTSRQDVPAGIDISNATYWAKMGDYTVDMSKIDTELNNNANNIATKADAADTTAKLATKANSADVYTKTATDAAIRNAVKPKANSADVYTKTATDAAISNAVKPKANSADVYTQSEIDTKLSTKLDTDLRTEIVWIGDSFSAGYQPSGILPQSQRIPYICASDIGLNPHVYANSASGFTKTGDGGLTINDMANQAIKLDANTRAKTKYVIVYAGFNDTADNNTPISGVGNSFDVTMAALVNNFPNAEIHYAFNCGANGLTTGQGKTRQILGAQAMANSRIRFNEDITWSLLARAEMAYNGNDPHPNPTGQIFLGNNWANILLGGSAVNYYSSQTPMGGGLSGNISFTAAGPNLSLSGKGSGTPQGGSATIANLPNVFDLGDNFLYALGNSGGQIAFWHLAGGNLQHVGIVGTGNAGGGNWWLPPVTFATGNRV
jgi:hypothetical protein